MELGCVATVGRDAQTIFIADAHRGDGKRFVVRADEKAGGLVTHALEDLFRLAVFGISPQGQESCSPKSSSYGQRARAWLHL